MIKKVFLCFILIAGISIILTSCSESPEKYNKRAFAVADTIFKYGDVNFMIASDCQNTWRSVIYDHEYISPILHLKSFCYGFNEALVRYRKDISALDSSFIREKKLIDSLYTTIKEAPDKSSNILNNIKELFNIYNQSYDMMLNPSGSLQTFTSNLNEMYQKFKDLKSKIEIDKK